MPNLPVALSIAGSDNSAGAGAQADLKTFSALGVYGVTALTCVVAEVPGKVTAIQPMSAAIVAEQIRLLFEAFPIAAVKTGMLFSSEIIEAVSMTLRECLAACRERPFFVVDPVMVATSGDALLQPDAVARYREQLFPLADLVTPNLDEARVLVGRGIASVDDMQAAGAELAQQFGTAFLLKGGHLREPVATDLLFAGGEVHEFRTPFVPGVSTHGTGCTYAAAIAANVAHSMDLMKAVGEAKSFLTNTISQFLRWEQNGVITDALHHFAPRE